MSQKSESGQSVTKVTKVTEPFICTRGISPSVSSSE